MKEAVSQRWIIARRECTCPPTSWPLSVKIGGMTVPPFPFEPPEALKSLWRHWPEPPEWLRREGLNRGVLWINHLLMQEPQAMDRLRRQQGKSVCVQWRQQSVTVTVTPAGLLSLADATATPDLTLRVTEPSPLALAQTTLRGDKPSVEIQGDVQLAGDVAWLVDHLRWDAEEDLSRVVGDATAHRMVRVASEIRQAAWGWLSRRAS